jgi:hypothetical protein
MNVIEGRALRVIVALTLGTTIGTLLFVARYGPPMLHCGPDIAVLAGDPSAHCQR